MSKKLLSFREYLNDELKDGKFEKLYEEEGTKIKISYKISQLRQKLRQADLTRALQINPDFQQYKLQF